VEPITAKQRKLLNAACGDLADALAWHAGRLSKDDWRHLLAGTVRGWRCVRGIDMGEGPPGVVMLGGSSSELTKEEASKAIDLAFAIGDAPDLQGLNAEPIRWGKAVTLARYVIGESEWHS
jgi:hypothetical protein